MIKKFIYLFLFLSFSISGQQTINKLITKELTVQDKVEVTSTTKSSKPCPVMTEVQRDAISSPATGSCVYNSNSLQLNVYDGSTWQEAGGGGISLWATGLSYDVNDVVIESDRIYRCLIAHTSGTFSTDLANGNWTEVSGSIPVSLQDTYEDSSQPQITTNTSGLGVQFKRGTLSDTDVVIEVLNGAGASKFSVTGEGSVSAGSTITATGSITGANLSGTNTGDLTTGGDNDTPATTATIVAPNKQLTLTGTNQYRLNTGNNNELDNPNFEHTTVTTGWTISNATSSSSTTRIEGSKSLSLALTGALSLSQSSTINAAQKSGVQMVASIWVNSSDVSDLQLCSLKNGLEDKCTVTGGYVQGSGWRQLTVSFLGDSTSNGLKLKSTDTTGTVLVDQAYVGIGSPVVDFTPDMVYSAFISATGVVSQENIDWLDGNCSIASTSQFTCNFKTDVFSVAPNCTVSVVRNIGGVQDLATFNYINSTSLNVNTYTNSGTNAAVPFQVICQKQGADYKTSKAYVASSSDYGWTAYTPTVTGLGTVSSLTARHKRVGDTLFIEGSMVVGTPTAVEARVSLPNGLVSSSIIGTLDLCGDAGKSQVSSADFRLATLCEPNVSYVTFGTQTSTTSILSKVNGNSLTDASRTFKFNARIPIAGWTSSSVIVGSFQGYNETPGTSRVETFSVSYGTTAAGTVCSASPCSYLDQIGTNFSSITRSTNGDYTMNLSKTYSKLKCTASVLGASTLATVASGGGTIGLNCTNCNSMRFLTGNPAVAYVDTFGTIMCQGIPQ